MKKVYLLLLCLLITITLSAQDSLSTASNPTLTIGSSGFMQGTINTDVLSTVIQEKQEEVKIQVFNNIIVKSFNKANATKDFRNFTTYHFMYQVMNELISGKNKQVMMQNITEDFAEFAYVYGFLLYLHAELEANHKKGITNPILDKEFLVESKIQLDSAKINDKKVTLLVPQDSAMYRFNLLIDLAYDLILTSPKKYAGTFNFNIDTTDQTFMTWYKADNVYRQALAQNPNSTELATLRADMENQLANFSEIDTSIANIGAFYQGLRKSNYKDFTLTLAQVNSMKFILTSFIQQVQHHTRNNVVAKVCSFFLDNTLVQYTNASGSAATGYLYIDVASVISAIDAEFSDYGNKGLGVYLTPFVSLGANQGYFLGNNQLGQDANGNPSNLDNIYFASEKIGFKYKLWNWGYTHSFDPGVNYRYYGKRYNWVRPQVTPTVSDLYLMVYGSGILYNLAELKSEENFNYGFVGTSLGITFFNKLSLNAGLAMPFTNKQFQRNNLFITFGFDIPISDYLSALSNK